MGLWSCCSMQFLFCWGEVVDLALLFNILWIIETDLTRTQCLYSVSPLMTSKEKERCWLECENLAHLTLFFQPVQVSQATEFIILCCVCLPFSLSLRWTCLCQPRSRVSSPKELKTSAMCSLLAHTKLPTVMMESGGKYIKMRNRGRTR